MSFAGTATGFRVPPLTTPQARTGAGRAAASGTGGVFTGTGWGARRCSRPAGPPSCGPPGRTVGRGVLPRGHPGAGSRAVPGRPGVHGRCGPARQVSRRGAQGVVGWRTASLRARVRSSVIFWYSGSATMRLNASRLG